MISRPKEARLTSLPPGIGRSPTDLFGDIDEVLVTHGWDRYAEDMAVLDEIELAFFRATPAEIHPYELTTLSWDLAGPVDQAKFTLDGEALYSSPALLRRVSIEASGEQPVSPLVSSTYQLRAQRGFAKRKLGSLSVDVNTDQLEIRFLPSLPIENGVAQYVSQMFNGVSGIRVNGSTDAKLVNDGLNLGIPLIIEVNNSLEIAVEIDLPFFLFAHRNRLYRNRFVASLGDVKTDLSITWDSPVGDLPVPFTSILEGTISTLLEGIFAQQLESGLADAFTLAPQIGINDLLASMGGPMNSYLLHSIDIYPTGIDIYGCPDPRFSEFLGDDSPVIG